MEERTKDNYPPEHQFLEYGSQRLNVPSNFSSNPSIRKTKKERKKTKIFGRMQGSESSESVNKEGLENLPPEKRKKKFEAKIHDIQSKIDVELKSRRGLEDILELYSQKPELGSPSAVEESRAQLDANSAALENLNEELFKYQCYLSALDPEKPPPEKPQSLSGLSNVNGGSGGDTVSITSGMSHKSHDPPSHYIEPEDGQEDLGPVEDNFYAEDDWGPPGPDVNADSTDTFATAPPEETFNDEFYEVPDNDNEFPLPVSPGEGCTVLYDYVAQHEDELNIFCGETLTILEDNGTGWVKAQRTETEFGLVPGNYIEKY